MCYTSIVACVRPLQTHTRRYIYSVVVVRASLYHPGCVEYHAPFRCTPENLSKSKVSHPVGTIHPQQARTGVDTGTSMETTAAPHHSGPIEPAAGTPSVPPAAAPRAGIASMFSGSTPLTGTGTATPAILHTPTKGTSNGKRKKL